MLTVQFIFHSAASRKHTKRHTKKKLSVLTARKQMTSQCNCTVNTQYGRPILSANLWNTLRLWANLSATVSLQICLPLSSAVKLGPGTSGRNPSLYTIKCTEFFQSALHNPRDMEAAIIVKKVSPKVCTDKESNREARVVVSTTRVEIWVLLLCYSHVLLPVFRSLCRPTALKTFL